MAGYGGAGRIEGEGYGVPEIARGFGVKEMRVGLHACEE